MKLTKQPEHQGYTGRMRNLFPGAQKTNGFTRKYGID